MLGCLGKTVQECMKEYKSLETRNERLEANKDSACKVYSLLIYPLTHSKLIISRFVCATSKYTGETVCLTSYKSLRGGNDLLGSVMMRQACRATSKASHSDPIALGPHEEEFVSGATGANNPIYKLWEQAEDIWGPDLETRIKCLVSVGAGLQRKQFIDRVFGINKTLLAFATDTEQTADMFRQDKAKLEREGRYRRLNCKSGSTNPLPEPLTQLIKECGEMLLEGRS
jgi:hypothetical protein